MHHIFLAEFNTFKGWPFNTGIGPYYPCYTGFFIYRFKFCCGTILYALYIVNFELHYIETATSVWFIDLKCPSLAIVSVTLKVGISRPLMDLHLKLQCGKLTCWKFFILARYIYYVHTGKGVKPETSITVIRISCAKQVDRIRVLGSGYTSNLAAVLYLQGNHIK